MCAVGSFNSPMWRQSNLHVAMIAPDRAERNEDDEIGHEET